MARVSKKSVVLKAITDVVNAMLLARFGSEEIYTAASFEYIEENKEHIMLITFDKVDGINFGYVHVRFRSQNCDYIATKAGQFFGEDNTYSLFAMIHMSDNIESFTVMI